MDKCNEHTGCLERIKHLEKAEVEQWNKMGKINDRIDKIFTRLNIVLGGLVVACILLVVNILISKFSAG